MSGPLPSTPPADLSDEREWKRLAAEATPGPWEAEDFTVLPSDGFVQAQCENGCDGGCDDAGEIEGQRLRCAAVDHSREVIADVYGLQEFAAKDGRFLAAARTAVPALLARLAAARGDAESLRRRVAALAGEWDGEAADVPAGDMRGIRLRGYAAALRSLLDGEGGR